MFSSYSILYTSKDTKELEQHLLFGPFGFFDVEIIQKTLP